MIHCLWKYFFTIKVGNNMYPHTHAKYIEILLIGTDGLQLRELKGITGHWLCPLFVMNSFNQPSVCNNHKVLFWNKERIKHNKSSTAMLTREKKKFLDLIFSCKYSYTNLCKVLYTPLSIRSKVLIFTSIIKFSRHKNI